VRNGPPPPDVDNYQVHETLFDYLDLQRGLLDWIKGKTMVANPAIVDQDIVLDRIE
jgi:hypothetical protein